MFNATGGDPLHDPASLTTSDRRRALAELADLYTAEADANDRPLTTALPALLPGLIGESISLTVAIAFFDRLAGARHLLGAARERDIDQLERRVERLLDFLVGESRVAVA